MVTDRLGKKQLQDAIMPDLIKFLGFFPSQVENVSLRNKFAHRHL